MWFTNGMAFIVVLSSCTFNFDITSQRTALENQILGTYGEIQPEAVIATPLYKKKSRESKQGQVVAFRQRDLLAAKNNRKFNRDDLNDLKSEQILGESKDGFVLVLPPSLGFSGQANKQQTKLAELLVIEENRDRQLIWNQAVVDSSDLVDTDIDQVKEEFVEKIREKAKLGHWLQNDAGEWQQKSRKEDLP